MSIKRGEITTKIIRNGLVFNMDAANRVSTKPISTITTSFNTIDTNISGAFSDNGIFDSSTITPSFAFGGTDDNIIINNDSSLNPTGDYTISSWFKLSNTSGIRGIFWSSSSTGYGGYGFWMNGTSLQFYQGKAFGQWYNTAKSSLTTGVWYNAVGVSTSTQNIKLYFNGEYNSETSTPNPIWYSTEGTQGIPQPKIGSYQSYNYYFYGNIGNVHLYNRALSAEEVLYNYNGLKSRFGL